MALATSPLCAWVTRISTHSRSRFDSVFSCRGELAGVLTMAPCFNNCRWHHFLISHAGPFLPSTCFDLSLRSVKDQPTETPKDPTSDPGTVQARLFRVGGHVPVCHQRIWSHPCVMSRINQQIRQRSQRLTLAQYRPGFLGRGSMSLSAVKVFWPIPV